MTGCLGAPWGTWLVPFTLVATRRSELVKLASVKGVALYVSATLACTNLANLMSECSACSWFHYLLSAYVLKTPGSAHGPLATAAD